MSSRTKAVITSMVRPLLENRLPDWLDVSWFNTSAEAIAALPGAEIGWLDIRDRPGMTAAYQAARDLKWMNSIFTGVDGLPLSILADRGITMTNGSGLNAITISEYVVMGMLTIAKGYREVVRAQDRHNWLKEAPGRVELYGTKAMVLGAGSIGGLIEERLKAFNVAVTLVRRTPDPSGHMLGPDQWRARLGEFDWVILAVPATAETLKMIGRDELAAMKSSAVLINIARGAVVDQEALIEALRSQAIGAAFLDVTEPEPLPADSALWSLPNAHVTMHLSGLSQTLMLPRAADRFLINLDHYREGRPLDYRIDLRLGY